MTDIQILTVAIAVVFPVLGMVISIATLVHSNKRVDAIEKRLDEFKRDIQQTINTGFDHMELLLKLHVAEHHHKP